METYSEKAPRKARKFFLAKAVKDEKVDCEDEVDEKLSFMVKPQPKDMAILDMMEINVGNFFSKRFRGRLGNSSLRRL